VARGGTNLPFMNTNAEQALQWTDGDKRSALWLLMAEWRNRQESQQGPPTEEYLAEMRRAAQQAWDELINAERLAGVEVSKPDNSAVGDFFNEASRILNSPSAVSDWSELPRRQQELARYMARGLTPSQIAVEASRSRRDIDARIHQLMRQTGASDMRQLRLWIAEHRPARLGLANLAGDEHPNPDEA
jgi:DNA-binding CsgD family transcriptional regulator